MQYLDIITTILGLIYIWLEYRASIWLWLFGIVMPALDIALYWSHGLYGDAGMAVYYTIAGVYGFLVWKFGKKRKADNELSEQGELPITHMPKRLYLPATLFFAIAWAGTWYVLKTFTNSTVPVLEQWFFWIVVDVVCCYLYVGKGIPFKAALYGLYVVIAVAGYFKWHKKVVSQKKIVILPSKS